MSDSKNFIPDTIKVGRYKHNSNYLFLTMKRRNGAWLFAGDFVHYTGYTPVDNPRDSIVAFERDATDKVRSYDNVPTRGFKIGLGKVFYNKSCIQIIDPRGWHFCIRTQDFFYLINNGVDITNGELSGEFVYSVIDDSMYNLVLVNSQDYQTAIKESEERERIKKIRSTKGKIELVEGRVYDYLYDKKNTCRAIYMGKMSRAIGWKLANWYKYQKFEDEKFNQERHVWLLLLDKLYESRYLSNYSKAEGRFNLQGGNRIIMKYDPAEKCVVRQYDIASWLPLKGEANIINMYFDDYFVGRHNHNFEFRIENIISSAGIDKLLIKSVSENQSYQLEKANTFRTRIHSSFKDPAVAFPLMWTFEDLKKAILMISEDWFRAHSLIPR